MVQLFIDGGGFMWPILGIGAIGLIFVGERLYHLISGLQANEAFALEVAKLTEEQGFDGAKQRCNEVVGPVANLCYNALENAGGGATWAAPIATLIIEKYLNNTIARPILEEQMINGNLINK